MVQLQDTVNELQGRVAALERAVQARHANTQWIVEIGGAPADDVHLVINGHGRIDANRGVQIRTPSAGNRTCRAKELTVTEDQIVWHTLIHNTVTEIVFWMQDVATQPTLERADGADVSDPRRT
jgi:hypothetical protein